MNMTPFDAYRTYLGIKRYFSDEKCTVPSPPRNVKYETFERRNDAKMFHTLCKKYTKDKDIVNLYVSNMLVYTTCWIGDLLTEECETNYKEWKKRAESLDYMFEIDMGTIAEFLHTNNLSFKDLFAPSETSIPHITKLLLKKSIIPETYTILDILINFSKPLDSYYSSNIVWKTLTNRFNKYKAFMTISEEQEKKYRKLVLLKLKQKRIQI